MALHPTNPPALNSSSRAAGGPSRLFLSALRSPLPALVILFAMAANSHASIMATGPSDIADRVMASLEAGTMSAASTAPASKDQSNSPGNPTHPQDGRPEFVHNLETPTGNGSSSSSSSSSVGGSAGSMPCVICAAVSLDDDSPTTRLAVCQSLSLPAPPGVDLLRPPQFL